jgi:hypothetical protein
MSWLSEHAIGATLVVDIMSAELLCWWYNIETILLSE